MKKILIGFGVLVALLLVAIFVVPGLIDWNDYKAEIYARAKQVTGRDLIIDGDIKLTILPAPALNASNVRLANMQGATASDMVRLKSLQVRVALGPLLSGQIQVQTVRLLEPVIELERLADGRVNWTLGGAETAVAKKPVPDGELTAGAGTEKKTATAGPDIILDSFVIENGTVVYRDGDSVERVEKINANVAAASINGPFESDGDIVLRSIPINYDVTIGKIIEQRTAPVSLALNVAPGSTKVTLSGAVVGLDGTPKFKGKVAVRGDKLSGLLGKLANTGNLPGLLGEAFDVTADLTAGADGADLKDLMLSLGDIRASGNGAVQLGKTVNVNLELAADSIDADRLLALPSIAIASSAPSAPVAPLVAPTTASSNKTTAPAAPGAGFSLPDGINANLRLSAKSVSLKGGLVREARLGVELAGGELTVSQLSAQLPGSADVAAFGFVVPVNGVPQFDGDVEISVGDLHGVLDWLSVDLPPVPSDRMRKLTMSASLTATPAEARLGKIDLQFDSSRLTGSVRAGLGKAQSVRADLTLDRLNLDAYLGPKTSTAAQPTASKSASPRKPSAVTAQGQANGNPLAVLSSLGVLKTLDATLKARVGTLVYKGTPIKDIVIDGKLADNTLTLANLSVAKMAGAKVRTSGVVSSLIGVPSLKDVSLDLSTGDLARLLRMAGVAAPMDSRKLGAVSLRVRADGSVLRPTIDTTVKGAGGSLTARGKVSVLPIFEGFDGTLTVKHKNLAALVRAFGSDYRPAGKLGPIDFSTALKARASGLELSAIKATVGPLALSGTANVALDGPRLKLIADLKAGEIVVDNFLGAKGKAALSSFIPAAFTELSAPVFRRTAALSSGRWSTKPLDLAVLKSFDADVKLVSDALVYGNYRITGADLATTVTAGEMRVERFKGGLFGGTIDARGVVTAANPSRFDTSISLANLNVAKGLKAISGTALAKGSAALELRLASAGYTLSDMVAALSGNGSIAMNKLDVKSGAAGTPMAAAFGLIAGLNDLGGVLSGKKGGSTLADVTGTFTIDKGIARSSDLVLKSGIGNGRATGSADLARWMVDVNGEVTVSQSFLGQVLNNGNQTQQRVPFHVSGRLDSPNVKIDTSLLQAAGIVPGLEKVLGKSKIGNVLQQIIPGLGGATSKTAQPSQPPSPGDTPPPPPADTQPRKIKPEDLLKGLFRGLGR